MYKQAGVRLVAVGETWCGLMEKCVLQVTGKETKSACGMEQFVGGVEACMKVGIHAMRLQWAQYSQEEEWEFLLINARNTFNAKNCMSMLWFVRHKWPSGT